MKLFVVFFSAILCHHLSASTFSSFTDRNSDKKTNGIKSTPSHRTPNNQVSQGNKSKVQRVYSDNVSLQIVPPSNEKKFSDQGVVQPAVYTVKSDNQNRTELAQSYIFYGKFGVNSIDKQGQQVCEYPSLSNCTVNTKGDSTGAAVTFPLKLNKNSHVQKMSFLFYSDGFLSKNPNAHFATGIRGKITRNSENKPVAVNGRGLIIGNNALVPANNGFSNCGNNSMQVESYFGDISLSNNALPANQVFPDSCSGQILKEKTWYKIEYQVTKTRQIGYKLFNENGQLLYQKLLNDPNNHISLDLNDFFIAHVFSKELSSSNDNWSFIIKNMAFNEFNHQIDDEYKTIIVGSELPQPSIGQCTGSYPSSLGVEVQGYSVATFGPSRPNTVYQFFNGSLNGCYWKCKQGYTVNDSKSDCQTHKPGTGLTVKVLDDSSQPIGGASIEIIGSLCLSTGTLHTSTTDNSGRSSEAFVKDIGNYSCGYMIKIDKSNYEIKRADGCVNRITQGFSFCDSPQLENSQVTVYLSKKLQERAPSNSSCTTGQFLNDSGKTVLWQCSCSDNQGWADVGGNCFHKLITNTPSESSSSNNGTSGFVIGGTSPSAPPAAPPVAAPAPEPAPVVQSCQSGEFLNDSGKAVLWQCGCSDNQGWADVGGNCFHKLK